MREGRHLMDREPDDRPAMVSEKELAALRALVAERTAERDAWIALFQEFYDVAAWGVDNPKEWHDRARALVPPKAPEEPSRG